jgi:hypothetical protein
LPVTLIAILPLAGGACADERLRQLGYTLGTELTPPAEEAPTEPEPCGVAFVSLDDVNRAVEADLSALPATDRPFSRYLSLASLKNRGACGDELELGGAGLSKLVNSSSRLAEIVIPARVDADGMLLRIDIRDYGWDRDVDIEGQRFGDGWEAVVASSPFAVELEGPAASFIKSEARSSVPLLGFDAFISAATSADSYYALLGVPDTLGALRQSLGLPAVLDPSGNGALRVATAHSRVVQLPETVRVVDRYATGVGSAGGYWEALPVDAASYSADPLHAQPDVERLIMFRLPNDLLGFAAMDASGTRTATSEVVFDSIAADFESRVVASCTGCHVFGPIPLPGDIDGVLSEEELEQIFEAEVQSYGEAVARTGHPGQGLDQISRWTRAFNEDLLLDAVASELWVEPRLLAERAIELGLAFRALSAGLPISREQFGSVYASALCTLQAGAENHPVAAECGGAP